MLRKSYSYLHTVAQHIPISLLELNTLGHAICALLIYVLWWEKPFEVDIPTTLQSKDHWDFLALAWMKRAPIDITEDMDHGDQTPTQLQESSSPSLKVGILSTMMCSNRLYSNLSTVIPSAK